MPKQKMSEETAKQKAQYRKDFGSRVTLFRQRAGLTQEELAARLGYKSKTSINKIEMGKQDVSQSKITEFADALNVTVDEMMGWEQKEDKTSVLIAVGDLETDLLKTYRKLNEIGRVKIYLMALQELESELGTKTLESQPETEDGVESSRFAG